MNRGALKQAPAESAWQSVIRRSITTAQDYLLRIQRDDGHWYAELEGDTILESEYIMTMFFLGCGRDAHLRKAANYIREKALPEGGWAIYPGGPPEVSSSAKAYFVLKLLGDASDSPHMKKARDTIRDLGGLGTTNSFTRIYLAIFGQVPWEQCPAVPPELILLPRWFPLNLYEMSSWSRGILVPLSIIWAFKPCCPVPEGAHIRELWIRRPSRPSSRQGFWRRFFRATDAALKFLERHPGSPWRRKALKGCEEWMIQHFRGSDGIGAIFPPIINSLIALRCLGYQNDHPLVRSQIRELEKLRIEEGDTLRIAPCFAPVWDTALTLNALLESGLPAAHPALLKAAAWVLGKEVKEAGDWKVKNPQGEPGGWYFEYANEFYPDVDDTFQVLMALNRIRFPDQAREKGRREAIDRALRWLLTMQNGDGGWASFDRGCDKRFLTEMPFADHNAMIDPSTADITGRGLETLSALGFTRESPPIRSAVAFLYSQQETDGSWFGRWGCNYIYGTWLALRGLACAGEDMAKERIQAAARWLREIQNPDGGWGELPASYDNPEEKGKGPSTPSQTAWALMALMAAGDDGSPSLRRGVAYLLDTQLSSGSWRDPFWTGTGFPGVFYLRYHLYATYFPLLALALFEQRVVIRRGLR